MAFFECIEADENCCLQALVLAGGDAQVAEDLCRQLKVLGESRHFERAGEWLISVYPNGDCLWGDFLLSLQKKVDDFNREKGGRAEIFETRLVAPCLEPASCIGSFTLLSSKNDVAGPDGIWLDSGHVFGSGSHPSTRLAVLLLEEAVAENQPENVLDVGCGSGLLSLISARLGAGRVVGVDVCPDALKAALHNVLQNDLLSQITITDIPLRAMRKSSDLILANVTLSVFYSLQDDIKRLRSGCGRLIVSGLQGRQGDEAGERLAEDGWLVEKKVSEGKWQAMLCKCDCGF